MNLENKKIAVFSHKHIGDTIFSEPILRELQQKNAQITLYVKSKASKDIIAHFSNFKGEVKILSEILSQDIQTIKQEKYDIALLLNFSLYAGLVSFFGKIKYRFGRAHEGRGILLTRSFKKKEKQHALDWYYDTLDICYKYFKIPLAERNFPIFKSPSSKTKNILLQVGTTRESKKIPINLYEKIISEIRKKTKAPIILVGDDVENSKKVEHLVDENLVGKTSLSQYIELIGQAQALFSPDTSAIHIAAAFEVKVFGFYGSTSPNDYGPLQKDASVFYLDHPCMPCYKNECLFEKDDSQHMQCMNIAVEQYSKDWLLL